MAFVEGDGIVRATTASAERRSPCCAISIWPVDGRRDGRHRRRVGGGEEHAAAPASAGSIESDQGTIAIDGTEI